MDKDLELDGKLFKFGISFDADCFIVVVVVVVDDD